MRWLVGFLITLCLVALVGYVFLKGYPFRLYSNWVKGTVATKYYSIEGHRPLLLRSGPLEDIPSYQEDYVELWKEFPIRNSLIQLPVRHPLIQTAPLVEFKRKNISPRMGILFLSPERREISRIYTFPTSLYQDHSQGQDLFKLPFVRNRILKYDQDKVWKDIFSFEIRPKSKSMDEMVYDLYLLHLRSKIFPKETIRYGLIKEGKLALIELDSKNKDYSTEVILTYDSGRIYSYLLRTELLNPESQKLRTKFLGSVSFSPIDAAMGNILYKEFKQLNFARQVDQEGMLYLFSAWSQELENVGLLKEMIFYLERGRKNDLQLKPLYTFALSQYGKTFTTRKNDNDKEEANLSLQRKIELEELEKQLAADREKQKSLPPPELTPDEKMNMYLKKAKEESPPDAEDMTIH